MKDFFNTPEIEEPTDYLFIFEEPDNGWWYKVDTAERLIDYHLKTAGRFGDAVDDICHHLEEYKKSHDYKVFEHPLAYPIMMHAEQHKLSIHGAATQFRINVAMTQLESIFDNGYIVINPAGGYHSGPVKYNNWTRRNRYVWPTFEESDIVIKQFTEGKHYYVRIGDMTLRNKDGSERFFSESDARMAAMRYVEIGGPNKNVDKDFISGVFDRMEKDTQGKSV